MHKQDIFSFLPLKIIAAEKNMRADGSKQMPQIIMSLTPLSGNSSISTYLIWILPLLCLLIFIPLIVGLCVYWRKLWKEKPQMRNSENIEMENIENNPKQFEDQLRGEIDQLKKDKNQLQVEHDQLKKDMEFLDTRFYRVDLTLDLKTANARLEVSKDGKSVTDTGNISHVSMSEERFESHPFVLAEQGFSEGRHYWEVEVGQKNMWDVGVASESAPRTGKITLSPQNGYWVIGCDRKDYWARTDPWTRLDMPNKPARVGIHLNLKTHEISFFYPERKHKLYTFLHVASGKFYPFFSTGFVTGEEFDNGELIIPPWFEKEEIVEENEINN